MDFCDVGLQRHGVHEPQELGHPAVAFVPAEEKAVDLCEMLGSVFRRRFFNGEVVSLRSLGVEENR